MPGNFNLNLYRGDTRRWIFKLWTDGKRTVPADLTGVTVIATIRDKATGGTFQQTLTCTVETPNTVNMAITPDQSRVSPAVGVWDLQLTYPSGDIYTVMRGSVLVTQDVTYTQLAAVR